MISKHPVRRLIENHTALFVATAFVLGTLVLVACFLRDMRHLIALQAEQTVHLAEPRKSLEPAPDELVIFLEPGVILLEDRPVSQEDLARAIAERHPARIIVRAGPRTPYSEVRPLLDFLGRTGVSHVTFSVRN